MEYLYSYCVASYIVYPFVALFNYTLIERREKWGEVAKGFEDLGVNPKQGLIASACIAWVFAPVGFVFFAKNTAVRVRNHFKKK